MNEIVKAYKLPSRVIYSNYSLINGPKKKKEKVTSQHEIKEKPKDFFDVSEPLNEISLLKSQYSMDPLLLKIENSGEFEIKNVKIHID